MNDELNWKAAADAAAARRAELNITQEQVIERMGPDDAINIDAYRKFEKGLQNSYRRRTLATISRALGWRHDHLWLIAEGRDPEDAAESELKELREEVAALATLVESIGIRIAHLEQGAARPPRATKPARRPAP